MEKTNKQILSENLSFYMEQKGIDRYDLCEALGFKYSTVSEWLSARKYPRIDKIEILANYFEIDKSDLIEDKRTSRRNIELRAVDSDSQIYQVSTNNLLPVPIIGRVAAGLCCYAEDNITGYVQTDRDILKEGYEHFWLCVKGDSMEPELHERDLVLVRKQETLDSECLAVVRVGDDDGVVKLVNIEPERITLTSLNRYYPPRIFTAEEMNNIHLVGKVLEIKRRLE